MPKVNTGREDLSETVVPGFSRRDASPCRTIVSRCEEARSSATELSCSCCRSIDSQVRIGTRRRSNRGACSDAKRPTWALQQRSFRRVELPAYVDTVRTSAGSGVAWALLPQIGSAGHRNGHLSSRRSLAKGQIMREQGTYVDISASRRSKRFSQPRSAAIEAANRFARSRMVIFGLR